MLVACICFVRTRLFYFVPLDNLHRRCLLLRCGSESYTMLRMVTDAHAPVIHILYAPRGKPRKTIFRKSVVFRPEVHDKTAKKKRKGSTIGKRKDHNHEWRVAACPQGRKIINPWSRRHACCVHGTQCRAA